MYEGGLSSDAAVILKTYLFSVFMFVLGVYVYAPCTCKCLKRPDPLELELCMVAGHLIWIWELDLSTLQAKQASVMTEPSLLLETPASG